MKLYVDLETYNIEPISRGTYRYAETAEIMLVSFAIDDGPVVVWDCTARDDLSERMAFLEAVKACDEIIAHNAMFDRSVLRAQMPSVCPPVEKWRCTMVQALSHGLPGSLDKLCEIFKVDEELAKDKAGKALVQLFCKPRPKNMKLRRATAATHPVEWARFKDYARRDVDAMRALHKAMPVWNYRGKWLDLWHLDQRINDRGFRVDVDLVRGAIAAVEEAQQANKIAVQDATFGVVGSAQQRDALLSHILAAYGVALPDLKSDTLERRANDEELPQAVRDLIALRLEASTSSTSKYKRLAFCTQDSDGRMRGTIQWRGAARTGRHAGRNFQPQNLPRVAKKHKPLIEVAIEAMKHGGLDLVVDDVMGLASACIRGCIVATPGRLLRVADYSNIEGRVLAWLAGEEWKLTAFRAQDADPENKALDLYIIGYARSFGVPVSAVVADEAAGGMMRLIGKVQELALGYQGSVGAYRSMAAVYGVDVAEADALGFVKAWRKANPKIVQFWYDVERAARAAIQNEGTTVRVGKVAFRRDGEWLRALLPSGRYLCYFAPRVDEDSQITYLGIDQYTRKWKRLATYGGKLVENITQATAADVLGDGMLDAESLGFEIVLHVHDEIISETGENSGLDHNDLAATMARDRDWHAGLPLAVAGYTSTRYRKG